MQPKYSIPCVSPHKQEQSEVEGCGQAGGFEQMVFEAGCRVGGG